MNDRSAPPAPPSPLTSRPARAGSPNGLIRNATTKKAIPPVVCPVTNIITDAANTKLDTILKIISDTDRINEKRAAAMENASANGAANNFRINLNITITNPFCSNGFRPLTVCPC